MVKIEIPLEDLFSSSENVIIRQVYGTRENDDLIGGDIPSDLASQFYRLKDDQKFLLDSIVSYEKKHEGESFGKIFKYFLEYIRIEIPVKKLIKYKFHGGEIIFEDEYDQILGNYYQLLAVEKRDRQYENRRFFRRILKYFGLIGNEPYHWESKIKHLTTSSWRNGPAKIPALKVNLIAYYIK